VHEALKHAASTTAPKVKIDWIDSEEIEKRGARASSESTAILVPGGFGERGIEGKIAPPLRARARDPVPRHLPRHADRGHRVRAQRRGLDGANSTEFDPRRRTR
jgi:CTP synthase